MSLEAAIEKLTAAVEANTAALTGGKAPATKAPAKKAPAKKAPAKKSGPTSDDLATAFGEYLKTGDKDDRAAAKANVKAIIDHFEVDRITNLDEDKYQEALDLLAQYKEGEDPLGGGEEEGDDDLM